MIKVLMLVPSLRIGSGVASFAMAYFKKLDHSSVQLDFACYFNREHSYAQDVMAEGSRVFYLPPVKRIFTHIAQHNRGYTNYALYYLKEH